MKKTIFAKNVGISQNTMEKMARNENVSLDVLVKICRFLNCTFDEIIEIVSEKMRIDSWNKKEN